MKTERFGGHHEAREALVLSVAGVTAIKRNGVNRAEIEEAVMEYLRGEPRTLRLLLERLCDAVEGEEAEKVEARIGA
jgi:hypothetical protein